MKLIFKNKQHSPSDKSTEVTKIMRAVNIIIILLIATHLMFQCLLVILDIDNRFIVDLANRFNLDHEISVVTWFSSILAFIVSAIYFVIGKNQQSKSIKTTWKILAFLLLVISIDEIAAAHELLLQGIHIAAGFGEKQTMLANAWLVMVPIIVWGSILLARRIHNLGSKIFRQIVVAGLVYITGALIVEYLSIPVEKDSLTYNLILIPIEEGLEMIGLALLLSTGLNHINDNLPDLSKKLKSLVR